MRILMLGGTAFVGRAIVEEALRQRAEVTVFSRGRTGTALFPQVERLVGDRDGGDYAALRGREWDAVVDVSGYLPRHVGQAMEVLGDAVGRYLFISSHAVYARDWAEPGGTEDAPLRPAERGGTEELTEQTYGPLKVASEQDVTARYGDRATIVRPGKVGGPHDPQDTFTYWVRRAARGGRVALPGEADQPTQVVDVRDVAGLVLRLLVDGRSGAFHAVGPAEPTTLGGLIHTCAAAAGTTVDVVEVPADSVGPLFPLVRPRSMWTSLQRSNARARAAGMPSTPLAVTAADVLAWDRERGEPPLDVGLAPADEEKLLGAAR